jgi:hypothetical protein
MENELSNILDRVAEMYFKYGIRSVTMDDISRELGISKKTLYLHIEDKADLVRKSILHKFNNPHKNPANFANNNLNAIKEMISLRNMLKPLLQMYNRKMEYDLKKYYPEIYREVFALKKRWFYESTKRNLEKGISEGKYRSDLNTDTISKLHLGRILYTVNPEYQIFDQDEVRSIDLFDEILKYHMFGICTEQGKNEFEEQYNEIKKND